MIEVRVTSYVSGELSLELIAVGDAETRLLEHAWRLMIDGMAKPRRGNGHTLTEKGSTGFYLPLVPDATTRPCADGSDEEAAEPDR